MELDRGRGKAAEVMRSLATNCPEPIPFPDPETRRFSSNATDAP
jgi:hypothetical protein